MDSPVARMKEARSLMTLLTGKPTRKVSLGRPSRRWEENIRVYFNEMNIKTRIWNVSDNLKSLVNASLDLWVLYVWS